MLYHKLVYEHFEKLEKLEKFESIFVFYGVRFAIIYLQDLS